MLSKGLRMGSALVCIGAVLAVFGCARGGTGGTVTLSSDYEHGNAPGYGSYEDDGSFHAATLPAPHGEMPQYATPGECYAQVYMPPEFEKVMERVCVREASEQIEIVPAEYEWIEEQMLVKEASTELVEVPAQFDVQDQLVQTSPGHATWVKVKEARCVADTQGPPPQDIFCLVTEPPTTMTIQTERVVEGPVVKEITVPAKYQTIRKQKLVRPATTRTVTLPAEFQEVEKTVMVVPGRMEWQRIDCDSVAFEQMNSEVRPAGDWDR